MANDIDRPRGGQIVHYDGPSLTPRHVPNNPIDRVLTRFDARGKARTIRALTEETNAAREYVEAQTAGMRSLAVYMEMKAEIGDIPAKIAHRAAITLENRKIEYEQRLHVRQMGQLRAEEERLLGEAKIQYARNTLEEARQQGEAIKKYGLSTHELKQKGQQLEALGLKLKEEELRREIKRIWEPESATDKRVLEQLNKLRAAQESAGMDTTELDELLRELG